MEFPFSGDLNFLTSRLFVGLKVLKCWHWGKSFISTKNPGRKFVWKLLYSKGQWPQEHKVKKHLHKDFQKTTLTFPSRLKLYRFLNELITTTKKLNHLRAHMKSHRSLCWATSNEGASNQATLHNKRKRFSRNLFLFSRKEFSLLLFTRLERRKKKCLRIIIKFR